MKTRRFEPCSEDFEARIIAKARNIEQKQSVYVQIVRMFSELYLPNPLYVAPAVFLLGLVLGVVFNAGVDISDFVDSMYLSL